MDVWSSLMGGFATALTPENLLYALIGVLLGTAVGVLPGLGPAMTVALLLPVTFALPPESAFIMFAGIYYGGMYGGSTTSILLNTPGESSSVVTAIEGHKMAKAGRAAQALATAAIGSFIAGTIGTVLLVVFAPVVVKFAVSLGNPSYFAIMILSLLAVTAVLGSSRLRGLLRARPRPDHRPGRRRPGLRAAAADLRPAAARRRHRRRRRGGRHLRRRRGAVGRRPPPSYGGARDPGRAAVDGQGRTGSGPGSPGCAARPTASRSVRCRPVARRSRRSCPT